LGLHSVSFQLFLYVTFLIVKIFRDPIFIFYLDNQPPVSFGETTDDGRVSSPFLCVRVHTHVCVYSRGPTLSYPGIQPGGFNFTADGAPVDARPFFPGSKVGQNIISVFPF
jgi:hypothetical protein